MDDLLRTAVSLLESGDDEGCDGLVVVGRTEFWALRKMVANHTNQPAHIYGCLSNNDDDDAEA